MAEIKLSKEIIGALQNCKDAKAVMALAKEKGVELSEEQAEKLFVALQNDKLNDEELEKVVGGDFKRLFRMFQEGGSGHTTLNMDIMN